MTPASIPGLQMLSVLGDAYRRGWQVRVSVVNTEHVLSAVGRRVPECARLDALRSEAAVVDRPSGPPPPYADEPVVNRVDAAVEALLREARWESRRRLRLPSSQAGPPWSNAVRAAARRALDRAEEVGVRHAHGIHLLFALLDDHVSTASALLVRRGVDPGALRDDPRLMSAEHREGQPLTPMADVLRLSGVLGMPRSRPLRWGVRVFRRLMTRHQTSGPVLDYLELEAIRQAVRTASARVTAAHLVVAMLSLDDQLETIGRRIAPELATYNGGGAVLREHGLVYPAIAEREPSLYDVGGALDTPTQAGGRPWRNGPSDPAMAPDAIAAVDRANALAARLGHPTTEPTHLLAALLQADNSSASRLLQAFDVDIDGVAASANAALTGSSGLH